MQNILGGVHPSPPPAPPENPSITYTDIHTQNSPTNKVECNDGQWNGTSTQYHMIIINQLNDDDLLKCYDTSLYNLHTKDVPTYLIDILTLNNVLILFSPN
jgi:hypothetical protein